jgi:Kinesin motor domain
MNSDSSRSHLICSIVISSTNIRTGSVVRGKLTLVDLAGSERVGKSGAAGDQLKEAQVIIYSYTYIFIYTYIYIYI